MKKQLAPIKKMDAQKSLTRKVVFSSISASPDYDLASPVTGQTKVRLSGEFSD
ncbi:MAG: hypothetical protein AAF423_12655 [Pseudomonadota bacterium]